MAVIGEPVRPQVLFAGYEDDDVDLRRMSGLVPTARVMPESGMDRLRAEEWDILIGRGTPIDAPGHMHVLALGCDSLGLASTGSGGASVSYGGAQPSEILDVSDDLPDRVRRLVLAEVVPWLLAQDERPYLMIHNGRGAPEPFGRPRPSRPAASSVPVGVPTRLPAVLVREVAPRIVPFVRDADGGVIAGAFERYGGGWCWALPFVPRQPEAWLALALEDWHEKTPARVPAGPGWRTRPSWSTTEELAVAADIEALDRERIALLADLDQREAKLLSEQTAVTAAADAGLRRLLTAQGSDLVAAVSKALAIMGFEVEDADNADAGIGLPKVEDLRVHERDDLTWTNITEVRGYKGGAKVSDLQRLARFALLRVQRAEEPPSSRWYVVNQFLEQDPDTRQSPLAGSADDVAVFAEDGGLIIDTRELFRMVELVKAGHLSAEAARTSLRTSTGVLRVS